MNAMTLYRLKSSQVVKVVDIIAINYQSFKNYVTFLVLIYLMIVYRKGLPENLSFKRTNLMISYESRIALRPD